MTTILVWYFISINSNREITYSPPLATLEDCLHLEKSSPARWAQSSQCVQLKVVKL